MKGNVSRFLIRRITFITFVMIVLGFSNAIAGGKVGFYGIRMVPDGQDAENYSRPGWGLGFHVVVPTSLCRKMFAGVAGIEIINLMNETIEFRDNLTGLRVEQQTDQNYLRFFRRRSPYPA